jgi:F-type H+-transporting ATPase subunit b
MHFDWSTLALQTVNFAILVWLLHRFLYQPVLRLIDARRAEIERQYAEAQSVEARAKDRLAAVEAEQAGIVAERAMALKEAAVEAEQAAAARRARMEREVVAFLEDARKTLAAERSQARREVRHAALELGTEIAARLLAEMPMELRAEAWIERIEEYLAGLPKPELDAVKRQLVDGAPLEVLTASVLPAKTERTWRSRLGKSLCGRAAVNFAVDPALIAGVELRFPNTVLRFSWQSTLAAIRAEIETDADAH